MDIVDLIKSRRTIRKFKQDAIKKDILMDLVDCGRLAPSARNLQPLEFFIVQDTAFLEPVFKTLRWAGYIAPAGDPGEGERPTAYIIVLINKDLDSPFAKYDAGAAIENISLTALSFGIGSCWLGAVDKNTLARIIELPDQYFIDSVIALGYPAETSVAEDEQGSIKYYKDEENIMHVPKRALERIVHMDRW